MMLQNIMENYLNNKSKTIYPVEKSSQMPLVPVKKEWVVNDKSLKKMYSFETRKQKEAFVIEMLKYIRESDAVIEIRIKNEKVAIVLHAISPTLSEIEFEAKSEIDKIRKDVVYFYAKKE